MKALLLAAAVLGASSGTYQIDLRQYFPTAAAEATDLGAVIARGKAFIAVPAASLTTPQALLHWLETYDALTRDLKRHEIYLHLRREEDSDDRAARAASEKLSTAWDQVDAALVSAILKIGAPTLETWLARDPDLGRFRSFIDPPTLARLVKANQHAEALNLLASPALDSLAHSYKRLTRPTKAASGEPPSPKVAFESKWQPFLEKEDVFAALLLPVVHLQDGAARLKGFSGAPEAAYLQAGLTTTEVERTLEALRHASTYRRYQTVIATEAARQHKVPLAQLKAWQMAAADTYQPALTPFPDAVALILDAVKPMGPEYAGQFARLFDPSSGRVDWCHTPKCDNTGFSVGYAGTTSALFYGSYRGQTDNIRALAHEAAHAVHRQLMNEHQPLAVYNEGPHFLFESFAIFNGLLLLDHLAKEAPTPAARAYYLHQFLESATYEVYGSARETDLEQSIYAGVRAGSLGDAQDLDALTLRVFSRYTPAPALSPELKVSWARNRLYFTDPLYDVNYLFAGLLALQYFQQFEADPTGFSARYLAFLKNGFTDTPQALEQRFLGIDLQDGDGLVRRAGAVLDARTEALAKLYASRPR